MCKYDLVTKDPQTKSYSLGPALMPLGHKATEKFDINAISKTSLEKLAQETKASVLLGIISNDQVFISSKYDGNDALSVTIRLHQSLHITHGAHGKAIFAHLPAKDQQRLLDSDQLFFHGGTRDLDIKLLVQELKFCREHGYSTDNGKKTPGTSAVSSPVFDHNSEVVAAIVVIGTFTEQYFETFGEATARTARQISKMSGHRI